MPCAFMNEDAMPDACIVNEEKSHFIVNFWFDMHSGTPGMSELDHAID